MGKIVVYPSLFRPKDIEERYPYRWDVPPMLEHYAYADFSRIVQKGNEKCNIPCLIFKFSENVGPVQFEMTWKEFEELAENLKKFLEEEKSMHADWWGLRDQARKQP